MRLQGVSGVRVLSGPLSNLHDLAANDATTALLINVINAVGLSNDPTRVSCRPVSLITAGAGRRHRPQPSEPPVRRVRR
ncbi:MAG TPA: hypothetical protein VMU51_12795 [Mycobacteriales bacterium]|nr:hypothetical protein [Mycobacteriales bacterium]